MTPQSTHYHNGPYFYAATHFHSAGPLSLHGLSYLTTAAGLLALMAIAFLIIMTRRRAASDHH